MLRGSCLCKTVRYEIDGPLDHIGNCHCSMCRKASGAAFVTWGLLDPARFRWTTGQSAVRSFDSSPGRQRLSCGRCGAALASSHDGMVAEVMLGSLDDDPGAGPTEHIFVGSKASWHEITDGLPQHAGWPPGYGP